MFAGAGLRPGSIALGSVKSNIGHLKAAAGAAGLLKAALALHHKVLPPSLDFDEPEPQHRLGRPRRSASTPSCASGRRRAGQVRTAGVSAFGFGGTNFHVVLEEYVPGPDPTDDAGSSSRSAPISRPPT